MTTTKECACKLSSGELTVEAAMGAEIFGEDRNGDFVLTVARPALQPRRGGRGERSEASYEMEVAMARWSGH